MQVNTRHKFGFQESGLKNQVSGARFQEPGFRSQVSGVKSFIAHRTSHVAQTIIISLLLFSLQAFSQNHTLTIIPKDTTEKALSKIIDYPNTFPDGQSCQDTLPYLLKQLQQNSYLAASFDSIQSDSLQTTAYLYLGNAYHIQQLNTSSISPKILQQLGYKNRFFEKGNFSFDELQQLQDKLLDYYENNGYPFVETQLDSILIKAGQVQATLKVQKNQLVTVDSLIPDGEVRISNKYLQNYLNIAPNQAYSEANMQQITKRITELPFLSLRNNPVVSFTKNKARITLPLKKRKASRFNFLIGVIPNPSASIQPIPTRRYLITGDGELYLHNALGAGELIELEFKSYPGNVVELDTHFEYPYLPLLPFGIDFRFDLYIKAPEFREINTYIGLQYLINGNNYFKAYWDRTTTDMLEIDTARVLSTGQLPDVLDTRRSFYGMEYHWEQLDYRLNPRKGTQIHLNTALGTRKVVENNGLLALDESIYERHAVDSNRLQFKAEVQVAHYWPIGKSSTLKTSLETGFISQQTVLKNELYRIGGIKRLRGFDDETIITQFYNLATLEYRFLWGPNSYLFGFTDANYAPKGRFSDAQATFQMGFGAGCSFETKAGVFVISYALGRDWQLNNNFQFRNGKVHFGYINYF